MAKENELQKVVEDMITDPDADAARTPRPKPPQTVDAEPNGDTPPR